jgi:hypothetical protein
MVQDLQDFLLYPNPPPYCLHGKPSWVWYCAVAAAVAEGLAWPAAVVEQLPPRESVQQRQAGVPAAMLLLSAEHMLSVYAPYYECTPILCKHTNAAIVISN